MATVFARYAKASAAVGVTVAAGVTGFLTDGMTPQEWVLVANLGLGAAGVAVVPNLEQDNAGIARYAKAILSFLVGGATVLATLILGGLTPAEVLTVGIAAFAAVGIVAAVPNATDPLRPIPVAGRLPGLTPEYEANPTPRVFDPRTGD